MEQHDIKKEETVLMTPMSFLPSIELMNCDIKINMFSILMFSCLSFIILILIVLSFFQSYQKNQKYNIINNALNKGEFGTASLLANNEILPKTDVTFR